MQEEEDTHTVRAPSVGAACAKLATMDTIGSRLRSLRARAGLTQHQLAAELGINRSLYSRWEGDGDAPGSRNLLRLSIGLGVSTDWLLAGDAAGHEVGAQARQPGAQARQPVSPT